jgi:hypothetical protein
VQLCLLHTATSRTITSRTGWRWVQAGAGHIMLVKMVRLKWGVYTHGAMVLCHLGPGGMHKSHTAWMLTSLLPQALGRHMPCHAHAAAAAAGKNSACELTELLRKVPDVILKWPGTGMASENIAPPSRTKAALSVKVD